MERSLWTESFPIGQFPRYPCPYCAMGDKQGSLKISAETFMVEAQPPLFHAFLRCDGCGHAVSVAGSLSDNRIFPKCFIPAIPLIRNPGSQGGWTGLLVEKSFELFWVDPASCANCLRSFLEGLLDDWGANGSARSLGERIKNFRDLVSAIEEQDRHLVYPILQGLKRIGNLGSHAGEVEREDLLDAFEDLEIALGIIYGMENEPAVARIKLLCRGY